MDVKLSDAAGQIKQRFASHMADYTSAHGGTYHKNLLHNWDFRNPVNQRGFTSTTNSGYTIDRWRLASSAHTAELVPKGIKITASSSAGLNLCFQQFIENFKGLEGETLTLSVHIVENTLTQGCNLRWNDHAGPVIMGTGYFSYTFTPSSLSSLYVGVQFFNRDVDDGKYVIIDKMKLEIGNVSTLANDPPADYGEQLALCQRYAVIKTGQFRASYVPGSSIQFDVPLPVPMRNISPTLETGSIKIYDKIAGSRAEQTGFSFSYVLVSLSTIRVIATKTSHGLTDPVLSITGGLFSADL